MKCLACGSTAVIEGTIVGNDGTTLGFYPSDVSTIKRMFAMGSRDIRAYGCIHCHNLQFAVKFSESDFERYQQFEGQQPDVLERINSDPKKLSG